MSQECWYSSHFCDNHGFPFRIHRCLSKETKKTRNEYKLSLIMTFISKFYLYKCSHCLGSQACMCSCKSQECWYSSHLCDSHGVHPCIHQFLEEVENIKLQRKQNYLQENEVKAFSRLQVYKRVRISIVEVYEKVRKSVSFRSVKGPKGLTEGFYGSEKVEKIFPV